MKKKKKNGVTLNISKNFTTIFDQKIVQQFLITSLI